MKSNYKCVRVLLDWPQIRNSRDRRGIKKAINYLTSFKLINLLKLFSKLGCSRQYVKILPSLSSNLLTLLITIDPRGFSIKLSYENPISMFNT